MELPETGADRIASKRWDDGRMTPILGPYVTAPHICTQTLTWWYPYAQRGGFGSENSRPVLILVLAIETFAILDSFIHLYVVAPSRCRHLPILCVVILDFVPPHIPRYAVRFSTKDSPDLFVRDFFSGEILWDRVRYEASASRHIVCAWSLTDSDRLTPICALNIIP